MKNHCVVGCLIVVLLAAGAVGAQQTEPPKKQESKPAEAPKTKDVKKPQPKRVVTDLTGFDLLETNKVRKQPMVLAATRDLPQPVALAPRLGKLYGARPVFAWRAEGDAKEFVFILRNAELQEIFRAEVRGTSFEYPSGASRLEPEKTYFWTVEIPPSALSARRSAPAGFIVVSASERASIEQRLGQDPGSDPYQSKVARARVFTDFRLWYDALTVYSELINQYPDQADLYEQRGMIYAQLETTQALAEQDFVRADQLRRSAK